MQQYKKRDNLKMILIIAVAGILYSKLSFNFQKNLLIHAAAIMIATLDIELIMTFRSFYFTYENCENVWGCSPN